MLADGSQARLHEDSCARILGNQWSGEGPFSITFEDGATLTGTFTSRATLPTAGEPYTLTITDGSGSYAGATGSCLIDNHVSQRPYTEVQTQWGPFTCTIQTPAADAQPG